MKVQHVDNHNPPSSISKSPQLTIPMRRWASRGHTLNINFTKSNINPRNTSILWTQSLDNWGSGMKRRITTLAQSFSSGLFVARWHSTGNFGLKVAGSCCPWEAFQKHRVDEETIQFKSPEPGTGDGTSDGYTTQVIRSRLQRGVTDATPWKSMLRKMIKAMGLRLSPEET